MHSGRPGQSFHTFLKLEPFVVSISHIFQSKWSKCSPEALSSIVTVWGVLISSSEALQSVHVIMHQLKKNNPNFFMVII